MGEFLIETRIDAKKGNYSLMANFIRKLIENDKKDLKRLDKIANEVETFAEKMAALSDLQLKEKTDEFRGRYQKGETLDQLLPEAFAVVREAAKRVLGLYPYHVQLMGGLFYTMVIFLKCELVKGKH